MPGAYVVLLPVKPPGRGKSRLSGLDGRAGVDDDVRRELAGAFALDCAAACLASERVARVLVTTDDADFAVELTRLGCRAVPDGAAGDLNAVLRQTAAEARRRWPDLTPAALLGDLPALRASELDEALELALGAGGPAYVGDADGSGTTLYTASYDDFDPHFGAGSRHAHDAVGAWPVPGELASLRRDVDSLDDLLAAAVLGLGARTAAVAHALEPLGTHRRRFGHTNLASIALARRLGYEPYLTQWAVKGPVRRP